MQFFCVTRRQTPDAKLEFTLAPTPTPDASQWNKVGLGSQRKILALAKYISFFCVDFIRVGYPTRTPLPVEYGLNAPIAWIPLVYP